MALAAIFLDSAASLPALAMKIAFIALNTLPMKGVDLIVSLEVRTGK
jgi:hypothetical protein